MWDSITQTGILKNVGIAKIGDVVVVYSLSRLGRGLKHLVHQVAEFAKQGVEFKSLTESIDTTTANGRLTFHIFCSIAEFERELLIERTNAGVQAARARGRVGGRKAKLNHKQVARLQELYNDRELSITDLCNMFGISRAALYRYLKVSALLVK